MLFLVTLLGMMAICVLSASLTVPNSAFPAYLYPGAKLSYDGSLLTENLSFSLRNYDGNPIAGSTFEIPPIDGSYSLDNTVFHKIMTESSFKDLAIQSDLLNSPVAFIPFTLVIMNLGG